MDEDDRGAVQNAIPWSQASHGASALPCGDLQPAAHGDPGGHVTVNRSATIVREEREKWDQEIHLQGSVGPFFQRRPCCGRQKCL
jgi:hypothetical protein